MAAIEQRAELLRRGFGLETSMPYGEATALWALVYDRDAGELYIEHAPTDTFGKPNYSVAKRVELAHFLKSNRPEAANLKELLTRLFWMEPPWSR